MNIFIQAVKKSNKKVIWSCDPMHGNTIKSTTGFKTRPFKEIDLSNYKNKVVVLNVWGSWCGPCRKEAKELQELYVKNKDSGVEFIGINIRDSRVSAEKFITNFGITYPNIFDRDGVKLLGFKDTLPANAIPSTVLVDKNGKVAARQLGPIERALIQGFISSLVDE